jgi:hypothetical protein
LPSVILLSVLILFPAASIPILFLSKPDSALLITSFSLSNELANCMDDSLRLLANVTKDVVSKSWSRFADSKTCSVDSFSEPAVGFWEVRLPNNAVVVAVSGGAEGFVAEALLRRVEARS